MPDAYRPADDRYEQHDQWFRRSGRSGLLLPAISIGCWHNFGGAGTDARGLSEEAMHENCRAMLHASFDHGITHFDLANNYGPPPGSAETRVGRILKNDFASHRDELILSSKAGYLMWPGPYGEWGSRKYLIASCDQSLKRLNVEYVDIFYSHRPDPDTPLEETLFALDTIVRQGKALYAGISSYNAEQTAAAMKICRENGWAAPVIHQPSYSMLDRWIEPDLITQCRDDGLGTIVFCPLAQGLLTGKYLKDIPDDSRAKQESGFLQEDRITPSTQDGLRKLNDIAKDRGQTLAQMALSWVLREQQGTRITSALIGASRPEQISENVVAAEKTEFDGEHLNQIDAIVEAM